MVQAFSYTHAQLHRMTVPNLKLLVRKHNFVNQTRGYSKMKKKELVSALMYHAPYKKLKKDKLSAKLVPGTHDPLYKGKGGVRAGAKKQFEAKHGKGEKKKAAAPKTPPVFVALPKRKAKKPSRYR